MEVILTNANIVLPNSVVHGKVCIRNGIIFDIDSSPTSISSAVDCDGDFLIPGIVDLHSDNLERHIQPRPGVSWFSQDAINTHEAVCIASGVTTVFESLCISNNGFENRRVETTFKVVSDFNSPEYRKTLKIYHLFHFRCEVTSGELMTNLVQVCDEKNLYILSLMDHGPGVGQWADIDRYFARHRRDGRTDEEISQKVNYLKKSRHCWKEVNRNAVSKLAKNRGILLVSHDDRTVEEISSNVELGVAFSEFPITIEAAREAKRRGLGVIAGSPNIALGKSHAGNIAASTLLENRMLDILVSDYIPSSLVQAAFICHQQHGLTIPESIALITINPADAVGLVDRGRIEVGCRADLCRVKAYKRGARVFGVWVSGKRIY